MTGLWLCLGCQVDARKTAVSEPLATDGGGAGALAPDGTPDGGGPAPMGAIEPGEVDTVVLPDGGLSAGLDDVNVGETCSDGATACAEGRRLLACEAGQLVEREVCELACVTTGGVAACGGACSPTSRTCMDGNVPAVCDANGQLQAEAPCADATPRCVEGECRPCAPGDRRCSDAGQPETCAEDGSAWAPAAACAGDAPVCVPETGSCGQCSPGTTQACVGALGNCAAGSQLCGDDSTWGPCSVQPLAADSCVPGDDATCDGEPNSGCACTTTVSCGPTEAVGICTPGTSACVNGVLGACQGAVFRAARNCASPADNDCDGSPDNTIDATCQCTPGADRACGQHPGQDGIGICREGRQACVAAAGGLSSAFGACQGSVAPRARDCRSPLDNDCNGAPDNTLDATCQCTPGQQRDCGIEAGSRGCSRGTETCEVVAGGAQTRFGACVFADVSNGTQCDDGNASTVGDSCQGGGCQGSPLGLLATGPTTACAIRNGGAVYCWGNLSNTPVLSSAQPARVDLPGSARAISLGDTHGCAIMGDGSLRCWGANGLGVVGVGSDLPVSGTAQVALPGVVQVAAGSAHSAALNDTGSVFVWGDFTRALNQTELYGPDTFGLEGPVVGSPFEVADLGQVAHLALGFRHICAALGSGQVVCWGRNDFSQLGRATLGTDDAQRFTSLVDGINDAVAVACGDSYSCALRESGAVTCWGSLFTSDLSNAINMPPTEVAELDDAVQISVGSSSACALRRDNTVACWGGNAVGELGTGSFNGTLIPQPVAGLAGGVLTDVVALSTTSANGGRSVCAQRRDRSVVCWGANSLGQLGDGTTTDRSRPVQVIGLPN